MISVRTKAQNSLTSRTLSLFVESEAHTRPPFSIIPALPLTRGPISVALCAAVFIYRVVQYMYQGFYVQASQILCIYVQYVCVCLCVRRHLFWGSVEQASVEEVLLLVALTPLQMSHSSLPSLPWENDREEDGCGSKLSLFRNESEDSDVCILLNACVSHASEPD